MDRSMQCHVPFREPFSGPSSIVRAVATEVVLKYTTFEYVPPPFNCVLWRRIQQSSSFQKCRLSQDPVFALGLFCSCCAALRLASH